MLPVPAPKKAPKTRYAPQFPLPAYRYLPGGSWPHPFEDPRGHSYGVARPETNGSHLAWMVDRAWLSGVDLFNHWYFWEAYEVWEPVWKAQDKVSPAGLFIQGLMQVAAALLKAHEDDLEGVLALSGQAEVRLAKVAAARPELFGLGTDKVRTGFSRWSQPARKKARVPPLDANVPRLMLRT